MQANAHLNPNIYITFTYKSEDAKAVYTSYPQLFKIRKVFRTIAEAIEDGKVYTKDANGQLFVLPQYEAGVVLNSIGKNNNWISLKPCVIEASENGITNYMTAVSIEMSTSNGYSSVLTVDEFLTVYTILNDIDLASIQCMLSLAFLAGDAQPVQQNYQSNNGFYQAPAPQQPQYQNYGGGYQQPQQYPRYSNNQQGGYQQRPYNNTYNQPTYNNAGYQPKQPRQAVATQPNGQYAAQPQEVQQPARQVTPADFMKPREEKPIMSLNAVEETPVSTLDFTDTSLIDDIFSD